MFPKRPRSFGLCTFLEKHAGRCIAPLSHCLSHVLWKHHIRGRKGAEKQIIEVREGEWARVNEKVSEVKTDRTRLGLRSGCWMLISFLLFVAHGKDFHLTLAVASWCMCVCVFVCVCMFAQIRIAFKLVCVTASVTAVSSEIPTCLWVSVNMSGVKRSAKMFVCLCVQVDNWILFKSFFSLSLTSGCKQESLTSENKSPKQKKKIGTRNY